jgi:hypothetical protein
MSCVTHISRINQVMMIRDQHPLYVMCDTYIPYQPSDGDTGYLYYTWHIMDVHPLSPSLGWYGISVSHMTYNGCWSPITITWLIRDICVTLCDTDIPYQPSDGDRGSTSIICHVWHRYPVSTKWWWEGMNIHYMSCVIQISRINQVMMIGDHHLVDTGYLCHTWHIMDVDPLSSSLGWYGISVSHITYNGCWSPITMTWLINQVMVIGDQHPLYVMCDTDIPYQPSDGDRGSTSIICHVWHRYPVSTKWWW